MSTEYPLTPFLDYAARLDFEPLEGMGWGPDLQPERRTEAVDSFTIDQGVGSDNPYAT